MPSETVTSESINNWSLIDACLYEISGKMKSNALSKKN